MPQIDKVGFFSIVSVSVIFCIINLFCAYGFMVLPHFSNLRAHFDISKDVFVKIFFLCLNKAI